LAKRSAPIVVDANIVLAALLKQGLTREIILDRGLDLRAPPWLWGELANRRAWLKSRLHVSDSVIDDFVRLLQSRITEIPMALLELHREEAVRRVGKSGLKDAPCVAAVMAVRGVLWTHDATLAKEGRVPTITTKGLSASP